MYNIQDDTGGITMANTNYGTGLDFDIEQYRKKMKVVPKPEEEKKEEKKAEEKKEEKKSSKPRSEFLS